MDLRCALGVLSGIFLAAAFVSFAAFVGITTNDVTLLIVSAVLFGIVSVVMQVYEWKLKYDA